MNNDFSIKYLVAAFQESHLDLPTSPPPQVIFAAYNSHANRAMNIFGKEAISSLFTELKQRNAT